MCIRDRTWSKEIFFLTKRDAFSTDRRLVIQINDSSESVMANIAEGFAAVDSPSYLMKLPKIQARGASKWIYIKLNDALARASSL